LRIGDHGEAPDAGQRLRRAPKRAAAREDLLDIGVDVLG
jgi:hypothetical protein